MTRIILILFILLNSTGCMMLMAAEHPLEAVDFDSLVVGMDRTEAEATLGGNALDHKIGNLTVVNYSFQSSNAWKHRAMIYAPFSLGDLIFAPIEIPIQMRSNKTATAFYDEDARLLSMIVSNSSGEPIKEIGENPKPERPYKRTLDEIILGHKFGE